MKKNGDNLRMPLILKCLKWWQCCWKQCAHVRTLDICSNFKCIQSMWLCNSDDDEKDKPGRSGPFPQEAPSVLQLSSGIFLLNQLQICVIWSFKVHTNLSIIPLFSIWKTSSTNYCYRSSTNPCHVFTNFPLFSSGIGSQHIIVFWNIAWLSLSFKL